MTTDRVVRVAAAVLVVNCAVGGTTLATWLVGSFIKTALCELFGVWCGYQVPLFP
jgi:hypothetical protein